MRPLGAVAQLSLIYSDSLITRIWLDGRARIDSV
jgi:hypothetical protein